MKYVSMTDNEYNFMLESLAQKTRLLIAHLQETSFSEDPAKPPVFNQAAFQEVKKKPHWTQTPKGKKIMAARKRSKK